MKAGMPPAALVRSSAKPSRSSVVTPGATILRMSRRISPTSRPTTRILSSSAGDFRMIRSRPNFMTNLALDAERRADLLEHFADRLGAIDRREPIHRAIVVVDRLGQLDPLRDSVRDDLLAVVVAVNE